MDTLTRWLLPDIGIKISFICATESLKVAQQKHTTLTSSSVALGRAMMGTLCLAAEEKEPTRIQLHLASDGPIKSVVSDASEQGHVRAYVSNPLVSQKTHHTREALDGALGTRGHASLFRRPEEGKFTQSTVPLKMVKWTKILKRFLRTPPKSLRPIVATWSCKRVCSSNMRSAFSFQPCLTPHLQT